MLLIHFLSLCLPLLCHEITKLQRWGGPVWPHFPYLQKGNKSLEEIIILIIDMGKWRALVQKPIYYLSAFLIYFVPMKILCTLPAAASKQFAVAVLKLRLIIICYITICQQACLTQVLFILWTHVHSCTILNLCAWHHYGNICSECSCSQDIGLKNANFL